KLDRPANEHDNVLAGIFDRHGERVAVVYESTFEVRYAASGSLIARLNMAVPSDSIAFDPSDNRRLVASFGERDEGAILTLTYRVDDKSIEAAVKNRTKLLGVRNTIQRPSWSRDGGRVASVDRSGYLNVWDAHSGSTIFQSETGDYSVARFSQSQ